MTIQITILGWQSSGLRCPDHTVALDRSGRVPKIALLQMPNGTGKTTTLNLIRSALSGKHHTGCDWTRSQAMSLQKLANRQMGPAPSTGEFSLNFMFNDRRYTITLRFDFDPGEVHYYTTDTSGRRPGFHPPHPLKPFLNPDFVNFFVFDGELADRLLNPTKTAADEAIRSLFQLGKLENMMAATERYWREQSGGRTGVDNSLGVYNTKLLRTESRLASFQSTLEKLEERRTRLTSRLQEIDGFIRGRVQQREDLSTRVFGHEQELSRLGMQLESQSKSVLSLLRSPAAALPQALTKLQEFRQSLDRVRLPESTSREFFRELAEEDACICGRVLDDATRATILERSANYLGDDDVQFLNQMKEAIYLTDQSEERPALLQEGTERIVDLARAIRETEQDRDCVLREMGEEDPEVAALRKEEVEANREIGHIEPQIARLNSPSEQRVSVSTNPDFLESVQELRLLRTLLGEKIAELTNAVATKWKCERVAQILQQAIEASSSALQRDTVEAANLILDDLLPHNRIRIREIDKCLVLRGQESGSVGENLSVAYAFLSTIFRRANQHSLPFVVDSPAGPIDADVRREVGALVPRLSHQFIAFTISTERMSFLDAIERATESGEIEYLTLFRLPNSAHLADVGGSVETRATLDGMLVRSRDYFLDFQENDEDEEAG